MKRITLKEWIEFLGMPRAAIECNVSTATIKAWRYGYRRPSIEKARCELLWEPKIPLNIGLDKTIQYFKNIYPELH